MHDFIRSPLQFTQPMTNQEWEELVLRASLRELQRAKRRMKKQTSVRVEIVTRRRGRELLPNRLGLGSAAGP